MYVSQQPTLEYHLQHGIQSKQYMGSQIGVYVSFRERWWEEHAQKCGLEQRLKLEFGIRQISFWIFEETKKNIKTELVSWIAFVPFLFMHHCYSTHPTQECKAQ